MPKFKIPKSILILATILVLISGAFSANPEPTESYSNSIVLEDPDILYLYWSHSNESITFELHLKDSKWITFGFANEQYSDVIVSWLDEKLFGHFSDRKLTIDGTLTVDKQQNWYPLDAFTKEEYTVLKFKRNIKVLCDKNSGDNEDLNIETGDNTVVFAHGKQVNFAEETVDIPSLSRKEIKLLDDKFDKYECPASKIKQVFESTPTSFYMNFINLMEGGNYGLFWNYTDTHLTAEIHARTLGWVGFGFSPNGGMSGSDVVVGWITSDGFTNFTDRYIPNMNGPVIDKNQDWKLLYSAESNGYTIFKFQRPINLCDPDDRTIEKGSPYVIFSYGLSDPDPGQDITYHKSNRGSKTLNIISTVNNDFEIPSDVETIEFKISNVTFQYINKIIYLLESIKFHI